MWFTLAPRLFHGRWLVVYDLAGRFVLHDIETDARRVLWEQDRREGSVWDMCSITSPAGQCVVYVLLKPGWPEWYVLSISLGHLLERCFHGSSYRKLLEFRLNGESGELVDSAIMDSPADTYLHIGSANAFRAGKSPFLSIPRCGLVFDTRTRIFYELPEFSVALVRGGSSE